MSKRRIIQTGCLFLSLALLVRGAASPAWLPADLFLRLDPFILAGVDLAAKAVVVALWPAALIILLTPLLGRFFCGWICPMGATLDASDAAQGKTKGVRLTKGFRLAKYHLLLALLAASLLGVSFVFLAAPISLITRFYGLLVSPMAQFLTDRGLTLVQPLAGAMDWRSVYYAQLHPQHFATQLFILAFFGGVFALAAVAPRFWCRTLCPAGAILALFSRRPAVRRRVNADCTACGKCARACPMGAIGEDFRSTTHAECLACASCQGACPTGAIGFLPGTRAASKSTGRVGAASDSRLAPSAKATPTAPTAASVASGAPGASGSSTDAPAHGSDKWATDAPRSLRREPRPASRDSAHAPVSRRAFLVSGAAGAGLAAVGASGLDSLTGIDESPGPGQILPSGLIRPPGALPEKDFLARCMRCGECMVACPTNTLQPTWVMAGLAGAFSPRAVPRRGPCEPSCHACGSVCPTGAIRALPAEERKSVKLGTAMVLRHKCLAWEQGKRCVVCDEVCPYKAVQSRMLPGRSVAVPVVDASRCAGCGYCEHRCPAQAGAAIVVEPMGAMRLREGSYREKARELGLKLEPAKRDEAGQIGASGYGEAPGRTRGADEPPGFTPDDGSPSRAAPGFAPEEGAPPRPAPGRTFDGTGRAAPGFPSEEAPTGRPAPGFLPDDGAEPATPSLRPAQATVRPAPPTGGEEPLPPGFTR